MLRRAVIFDMDETIGYFSQLGLIIDSLENHIKRKLKEEELFHMMDIFHNIFRPGIINIFKLLKREKKKNKYLKVVIFTNNTGPKSWMHLIRKYIEHKVKDKNLFDKVIGAWKTKVDGVEEIREECRSSYEKTYVDLLNCYCGLAGYKICFLDDVTHPGMIHKRITYLHLKPYRHEISYETIVDTLLGSSFKKYIPKRSEYIQYLKDYLQKEFFEYKHINKLREIKYSKKKLYNIINNFIKNKKMKTKKKFINKKLTRKRKRAKRKRTIKK
jgi:hypothetical protein